MEQIHTTIVHKEEKFYAAECLEVERSLKKE